MFTFSHFKILHLIFYLILCSRLWRKTRITALHAAVSDSIPGRARIKKIPETRRDGRAEPQSLVSVLNIPGLNPKSVRNAYDVKAYVVLIAIMAPGFPFIFLTSYSPFLHYATIQTLTLDIFQCGWTSWCRN